MMDFLYGELSESEAAQFRERLAADPELEAELAAFERTREAFQSLSAEDPPPAVSARLLHEAAKRAPAKRRARTLEEGRGWWAAVVEFFQPVMRHPAAASLAGLLLVGGVAGALYLRGVDEKTGPIATSRAPAPGAEPATEGRAAGVSAVEESPDPRPGYFGSTDGFRLADEAGDLGVDDNKDLEARLAEPEQERALREKSEEAQAWSLQKNRDKGRAAGARRPNEPLANAVSGADPLVVPEDRKAKEDETVVGGKTGALEQKRSRPARGAVTKKPAPPPRSTAEQARDDFDFSEADEAPMADAPAPSAGESVTRSQQSSGDARRYRNDKLDNWARSKQGKMNMVLDSKKSRTDKCREAAKIANDILDKNPEYYYDRVAGSKRLKPCNMYVSREKTRRAKRRQKKTPAKAAPTSVDAAESAE